MCVKEGNPERVKGRRDRGYFADLTGLILSMNRYLLVVTPGLERLLCDEISTLLGRTISRDKGLVVIKGGIEMACVLFIAWHDHCSDERGVLHHRHPVQTRGCDWNSSVITRIRATSIGAVPRFQVVRVGEWSESSPFGCHRVHLLVQTTRAAHRIFETKECHNQSSHKSALYHTKAIEERILNTRVIRGMDAHSSQVLPLHFFFSHDVCTVSCVVGGFYKRGYRDYVSKAPLRETLAAAVAYASLRSLPEHVSYRVLDPFCGTGTLLQEWYSFTHGDDPARQRRRLLEGYSDVVERRLSQDDSDVIKRSLSQDTPDVVERGLSQYTSDMKRNLPHKHTHSHSPWHPFASFPLQGSDSDGHAIKGAVHNTQRLLGTPSTSPFTFTQLPFSQFKHTVDTKQPLVILSNVRLNTRDDV